MAIHAVIMAGGKGERLWPVSKPGMPKQLHSFGTDRSLLRSTFERLAGITGSSNIYIVTNAEIAGKIQEQLPELPPGNILVEPVGRNTAPCVAYAALHIAKKDPEAVMAVFPADHLIGSGAGFHGAISFGINALGSWPDTLITLGMVPDHPETGYGYIAPGNIIDHKGDFSLHHVLTFKEKPDAATAQEYIDKGFLWNAGMFIWRVQAILNAFKAHMPKMYGQLMSMGVHGEITEAELREFYETVEPVSIDYGIMEKTNAAGVIPAEFGWDDIGSWDALGKILPNDESGNAIKGDALLEDSKNNVVWSTGKRIVLIGVEDFVVVEAEDSILVCPRNKSQQVSKIAKKMK